jgi:hypothetical protein
VGRLGSQFRGERAGDEQWIAELDHSGQRRRMRVRAAFHPRGDRAGQAVAQLGPDGGAGPLAGRESAGQHIEIGHHDRIIQKFVGGPPGDATPGACQVASTVSRPAY